MVQCYVVILIFVSVFAVSGQSSLTASVVHDRHTIQSTVLGEERTVLVKVPPSYGNGDQKYPVVFMLDAHAPQNAMMAGLLEQQAWGRMIPEMILVGIQNTNRLRDLSPTKTDRAGSGGGAKFLEFIEKEVVPVVEKNYRTHPYRIIAGHSLGGLFAVYSFVARPDIFNGYIAASPSLDWDHGYVLKQAEGVFREKKDWKKVMFVGLGDEPEYVAGFDSFREIIKKSDPKGLSSEFRRFPDENHSSVVLPAYYAGLRKVFEGWSPPRSGSVSDLENHYEKLTKRFGYFIPIPENLLNQIGYELLAGNKAAEAIDIFRKNVNLYPSSANVYDSLAEAFERNGQLKESEENYRKALKLAEASGDADLVRAVNANLDRIKIKMR
ncbi:MAG: alpha/beta hydrolase-fold protein [Pyrinomonadaceae bacterium]